MAINRRIAIYVIAITTVLGAVFFLSWFSSQPIMFDNPVPWLWIDVQFEEGYLNVTMTNNDNRDYMIGEVILSRERTILAGGLLHETILRGEQISTCINFNWASDAYYEIIVRSEDGKSTACGMHAP